MIIPTYNCARFIERTLGSVRAQHYTDYEVIVVDDGSTDDTHRVLEPWANEIIYVRQINRGPSAARNLAVDRANGEFLAFVDADDMWHPDKLARQVAFLDENPECALVHGDVSVIDEDDHILFESYRREWHRPILRGRCTRELLQSSVIHMPTVMERRCFFEQVGSFDESFWYGEDYMHWVRLALEGHVFGYIEQPLALYRWRDGSLSRDEAKVVEMSESMIRVYRMLLDDESLRQRLDPAEALIVCEQIVTLHRGLAYQYRALGRGDLARRHATAWRHQAPGTIGPYMDWLKACMPEALARILGWMRA